MEAGLGIYGFIEVVVFCCVLGVWCRDVVVRAEEGCQEVGLARSTLEQRTGDASIKRLKRCAGELISVKTEAARWERAVSSCSW